MTTQQPTQQAQKPRTLRDDGFRFVCRAGVFAWGHPLEVRPGDLDCTDMSDEQFEQAVKQSQVAA